MMDVSYMMPEHAYHAIKAFSSSWAKAKTPAHAQIGFQQNDSMRLGSAVHSVLLGGKRVVELPDLKFNTKEGKEEAREQLRILTQNTNAEFVSKDDFHRQIQDLDLIVLSGNEAKTQMGMVNAVKAHPIASRLLELGRPEVSITGNYPMYEVPAKARLDWIGPDYVMDLKTASDASETGFMRAAYNFGYHIQAAFYVDMAQLAQFGVNEFYFVVVENSAPFAVNVFRADPAFIEAGREDYQVKLEQYAECLKADHWPAYDHSIKTLDLPRWAKVPA